MTFELGSTLTFYWVVDKRGKQPVLDDLKILFKCKNTSSNDTYDNESLWHLIEEMKISINCKEALEIKDNLTREAFALRKLNYKGKDDVQQREYLLTNGDGTAFTTRLRLP